MKTRNFALCALGFATAITLVSAGTASAQATSDKRIPVRKDTKPPEVPMAKTDTIRLPGRVDTVMVRGRTDTVTVRMRPDTVVRVQMETLPTHRLPGLYFGLAAGVASPIQHFRDNIHDGLDLNGQVGWFPTNGTFGLRGDVNWANFAHRKTDCLNCPDTKLLSGTADLVMRFPLDRKSYLNPVIYLLGGGGIDKFTDFIPYRNTEGVIVTAGEQTYTGNPPNFGVTTANRGTSSVQYHWDAGIGYDLNVGPAHMFVESRYMSIGTNNGRSHYLPSIIGFKFY
ncbi:MAG: hypothetical protein JWM95_4141 [Gemmatimonadetes bacterium]|nr:hypothetical protein [Gemmatimonadota bacterium]